MLSGVPSSLSPVQQRFVDGLRVALDGQTFERFPPGGVALERDADLKVTVKDPEGEGGDIRAFVRDEWITLFLGDAHEDFKPSDDADDEDEDDGRDFVDAAVAWLVDALRGRIEFTAPYRGTSLLSARYVRHDDEGTERGASVFLTPGHLRLWQPTHRVQRRPS